MTAGFDTGRRQWRGRSDQRRSLASVPAAGVEPAALHTRFLRVVQQPGYPLPPAEQAAFTAWAKREEAAHFEEVAAVRQLAVIAAAEAEFADDSVFPPSPALRVNWGRAFAWSPIVGLAAAFIVEHWRGFFWFAAFGVCYLLCRITPAGRR